jgi:uncharacterized repeat protein (TIGR04076 family)
MSDSEVLKRFGERVGYAAEDLEKFPQGDPRIRHLEKVSGVASQYSIEARVVESRHCNSGYVVGDRFVLDLDGNFIAKLCPKRLCVYAVSQLVIPVALINERISEGLDPNQFHFMRQVRCPDVGVECSGYGGVTMRVSVVPRVSG